MGRPYEFPRLGLERERPRLVTGEEDGAQRGGFGGGGRERPRGQQEEEQKEIHDGSTRLGGKVG
jgi:hypothetical protein